MSRRCLSSCLCVLALWPLLSAIGEDDPTPPSAGLEALTKLDRWVGRWKGTGWSASATGQRVEFALSERVEKKAGDSVLLVEGRGTTRNEKGEELVTHDGLALVYFDTKSGQYRWNGHERASGVVDAGVTLVDGGLEWAFPADERNTLVRFQIHFDDEQWHEVGDVSVDGKSWARFMEATLERE